MQGLTFMAARIVRVDEFWCSDCDHAIRRSVWDDGTVTEIGHGAHCPQR